MAAQKVPERYFYHSFPRRSRGSDGEDSIGLEILELIRDFGLLVTPEIARWEYPHADGTPPRSATIVQRRLCFTELSPPELTGHAEEFGHFALEFDIDTLKGFGAIPVFYVPRIGGKDLAGSLGDTIVMQLIDLMRLVDRISSVTEIISQAPPERESMKFTFGMTNNDRIFELRLAEARKTLEGVGYALTPPKMLSDSLEGALNFFYPADDVRTNEALKYYRQREWRICGNYAIKGEELMRLPSDELIARLIKLDANFFGRPFPSQEEIVASISAKEQLQKRLVDWTFVFPGVAGKRILQDVRRVIVPATALGRAKQILAHLSETPEVITISDLDV